MLTEVYSEPASYDRRLRTRSTESKPSCVSNETNVCRLGQDLETQRTGHILAFSLYMLSSILLKNLPRRTPTFPRFAAHSCSLLQLQARQWVLCVPRKLIERIGWPSTHFPTSSVSRAIISLSKQSRECWWHQKASDDDRAILTAAGHPTLEVGPFEPVPFIVLFFNIKLLLLQVSTCARLCQ